MTARQFGVSKSPVGVSHYGLWFLVWMALPLAAQHRIDLFAGGALRSGAPAREVALGFLNGIARDPAGNIVFAENGSNLIRRIARDGTLETIAGTGETAFSGDGGDAARAALNQPAFPRYDAAGNLYFADTVNFRIRRVDAQGVITTIAGTGVPLASGMDLDGPALERSLGSIVGLAVAPSGTVYFSEQETYAIRRVSAGRVAVIAGAPQDGCFCSDGDGGPALAAHFYSPGSLALDPAGNLYVSEQSGHIRRIALDGTIDRFAGYGPQPPLRGTPPPDDGVPAIDIFIEGRAPLAAGPDGSLYVADPGSVTPPRIRRIHPNGIADTVPGSSGKRDVIEIAAAADGSFAVIDSSSVSVLADATLTNVAGSAPKPAPDGTPARDAWLLSPSAIAVNSKGDLYIAESGACSIRKVGADGVLRTAAGTGKCAGPGPFQPAAGADLAPFASLAIDREDRLWVCDDLGNFYSIGLDGSISLRPLPAVLGPLTRLAIDSKDRVYVLWMFSLARVGPDGKVEAIVNPPSAPGVPPPGFGPTSLRAIGVDPSGNVYFTGSFLGEPGDSVFRVNDDGSFTRLHGGSSNSFALAVDDRGTVWQADGGVSVIDSAGSRALGLGAAGYAGDGGPLQSARMSATGIARAPSGDLFLLDGSRIRRITGSDPKVPPAITAGGVVNAASYDGSAIAPGEVISIFGSGFASEPALSLVENNRVPVTLGDTRVSLGGRYVPILAATPTQVNVIVPSDFPPGTPVDVVVQFDTAASAVIVPVAASVFGLVALDGSGSGPGAILNQDGTVNSAANPALRGSVVSLFGTGVGNSLPDLFPGAIVISTPYPKPEAKVTSAIGDQPAEVIYAGSAPLLVYGATQINVRVPAALAAGPQPVVVMVNGFSSRPVTLVVR